MRAPRPSVAVLALVLPGLAGCALLDGDVRQTSVVVPARRAELRIVVPAEGSLESMQASPVAVPRVPTGALKVKEVLPEGSIVSEGDIVVVFDDTQLNIELSNHKASFRSSNRQIDRNSLQATIESGNIDAMREVAGLERDHALAFALEDEYLYSHAEILESEVRKDVAEETILFAEASLLLRGEYYDIEERILEVEKGQVEGNIGRVETSLASLVLRAPIGGLVLYKKNWRGSTVAVGDSLWPGNVIMSIVDPDSTALAGFVLEKDAAGVDVGGAATLRIDARSDRELRGRVSKVAKLSRPIERGSPVKYFEVEVEIEDTDRTFLRPGMKGTAWIETGRVDEAVIIPRSAVRGEAEAPFVVVENGHGPERREVVLGPGDAVQVSVEEGVVEGDRIVLGEVPAEMEAPPDAGADEAPARVAARGPS